MTCHYLAELSKQFKEIRTDCTGIMGYLAMLQEGDFIGSEKTVVANLLRDARTLLKKLDKLRDLAVHPGMPTPAKAERDVMAAILASEPAMRASLQQVTQRLELALSTVLEWPRSESMKAVEYAQQAIRELGKIDGAFESYYRPTATPQL